MTRGQLRNTLLFAATLALGVVLSTRDEWSLVYLRYATYFTCFGASFIWLLRLHRVAKDRAVSLRDLLRESAWELALAASVMAMLFATHDFQFKVLSDETSLVASARSLSSEWRFDFPEQSTFTSGVMRGSDYVFDKRPPLFAFVLSLVDSLTGYRVRNVWFLNGAILGATIVVTAVALKRRLGRPWNLLAVVWGLANPIVMMTASAAGVEPIVALVWAIAGALAIEVVERGDDATFELFLATIFMLGLARLEAGPLGVILLGASIAASPARPRLLEKLREEWLLWLAPIVAMPAIVQRARVKDYFQGTTEKPFALEHVVENVHNWGRVLYDGGRYYPFNSVILGVELVAVAALVILTLRAIVGEPRNGVPQTPPIYSSPVSRGALVAFLTFTALTASLVALYSLYYWGQPTKATSARFYALPLYFAGLAVIPFARRFSFVRERPWAAGVVTLLAFAFARPAGSSQAFLNSMPWRMQHAFVTELVLPRTRDASVVLVSEVPAQFTIYDLSSMSFAGFAAARSAIDRDLERKVYGEVLVLQQIVTNQKGAPTAKTALPKGVDLETIAERQYSPTLVLRLSRVLPRRGSIKTPKVVEPAPDKDQNGMSSSPPPPDDPPP